METKDESGYFHHLDDVHMTYFEHFLFSSKLSLCMFFGCVAAFIHAIYPDVFETSTTDIVNYITIELSKHKHKK